MRALQGLIRGSAAGPWRVVLDLAVAAGLFWAVHAQYRAATGMIQLCDSMYSLAAAERLLTAGTLDFTPAIPADPAARRAMPGYLPETDLPYHFARHTNPRDPAAPPRIYYGYPLGSTVVSLPFVRGYVQRGISTLHPDGTPDPAAEGVIQQRIAARVAAATVVGFYVLARFFGPVWLAAVVAAGFGLGSPVFSTLSRALWSHTWQVFFLTLAVVTLIAARRLRGRPFWAADLPLGLLLGSAVFWMTFVRPHAVLSAAAIGVYLLGWHRRLIPGTLAAGLAWTAALVTLSYHAFGSPMPPTVYEAGAIDGQDVPARFFWLMLSPSRGLLVFCPYLVGVAWLLVAYRRHLADAPLLVPAGLAVGGYAAVFSAYVGWHAGYSYGPRYFADVFPWFALAAAMGAGAMVRASGVGLPRKAVETAILTACVAWAVFVHSRGANAVQAWEWNYLDSQVKHENAVKDWHHPQFLAGLTYRVLPDGTVVER